MSPANTFEHIKGQSAANLQIQQALTGAVCPVSDLRNLIASLRVVFQNYGRRGVWCRSVAIQCVFSCHIREVCILKLLPVAVLSGCECWNDRFPDTCHQAPVEAVLYIVMDARFYIKRPALGLVANLPFVHCGSCPVVGIEPAPEMVYRPMSARLCNISGLFVDDLVILRHPLYMVYFRAGCREHEVASDIGNLPQFQLCKERLQPDCQEIHYGMGICGTGRSLCLVPYSKSLVKEAFAGIIV